MTNLFKILTDLYVYRNKELEAIFRDYRRQQPADNSHSNMISYMTMFPSNRNEAREQIRSIINHSDNEARVASIINSSLTKDGQTKLFTHLLNNAGRPIEELIADFESGKEDLMTLFTGVPHWRVVVDEARQSAVECQKKTEGRYDIYLYNPNTEERRLIDFPSVDSKIIYLWFLIHPQTVFTTITLRQNIDNISKLMRIAFFSSSDEMATRLKAPKKEGENRDGFEKFWLDHKGKANKAVRDALDGADMPEWYTIGDRNDTALSLPHSCIDLPHNNQLSMI